MTRLKRQRSFFIVLAAIVLLAALWSYMLLTSTTHQTVDQHVHSVASQLKCPICQGESVADSPSLLAQQMRQVIRQELQAGQSDQEIIQYFENSYGEQILWSPPWQGFTLLVWLVPMALFLGGVAVLLIVFHDWRRAATAQGEKMSPITGMAERNNAGEVDKATSGAATRNEENEAELERYRKQLEQELADEDVLFADYQTEAQS